MDGNDRTFTLPRLIIHSDTMPRVDGVGPSAPSCCPSPTHTTTTTTTIGLPHPRAVLSGAKRSHKRHNTHRSYSPLSCGRIDSREVPSNHDIRLLMFFGGQIVQMNFITSVEIFNDCGRCWNFKTVSWLVKLQWMKCGNPDIEYKLAGNNVHIIQGWWWQHVVYPV